MDGPMDGWMDGAVSDGRGLGGAAVLVCRGDDWLKAEVAAAAAAGRENKGRAACQLVMARSSLQSVEEGEEAGAAGKATKVQTAGGRVTEAKTDRMRSATPPSGRPPSIHLCLPSLAACTSRACLSRWACLPCWGTQD